MFGMYPNRKGDGSPTPFNNSFGKLERLNTWWEKAGEAKIAGFLEEYYNCLENIFTELYAHLSKSEIEETNKELIVIERYLDNTEFPSGYDKFVRNRRRKGSNLCDKLARKLSLYSKKYRLEWLDLPAWRKEQREAEPFMRG